MSTSITLDDITDEDRAFLYACVMGDGHVTKTGALKMIHSASQRDYLEYKAARINRILGRSIVVRDFDNQGYPAVRFNVSCTSIMRPLRDLFYGSGVKRLDIESVVECLTPEALAVWWMDDGSCTRLIRRGRMHGYLGYLSTYLPEQENLDLIRLVNDKFGFNWKPAYSKGKYRIYLNTMDIRQLREVITPYVIPSLGYKIAIQDILLEGTCIEPSLLDI